MKVLIAQFVIESNANIPYKSRLENFNLLFGEDCIREMKCEEVFGREGVEIIHLCQCGSRWCIRERCI